eukprot:1542254-Pyramimonas_sp.AAC.2
MYLHTGSVAQRLLLDDVKPGARRVSQGPDRLLQLSGIANLPKRKKNASRRDGRRPSSGPAASTNNIGSLLAFGPHPTNHIGP